MEKEKNKVRSTCIYLEEYHFDLLAKAGILSYGKNSRVSEWIRNQIEKELGQETSLEQSKLQVQAEIDTLNKSLESKKLVFSQIEEKINTKQSIEERYKNFSEEEIIFIIRKKDERKEGKFNLIKSINDYKDLFNKTIKSEDLLVLLNN